jgi:hypothetical protein
LASRIPTIANAAVATITNDYNDYNDYNDQQHIYQRVTRRRRLQRRRVGPGHAEIDVLQVHTYPAKRRSRGLRATAAPGPS